MEEERMPSVSRGEIIARGLLCHCPNCGKRGLLASWFRLGKACASCGMDLARSAGIYSGTTSIGYVAAILFVIIPVCFLVTYKVLSVTAGVLLGIFGTFGFIVLIYPLRKPAEASIGIQDWLGIWTPASPPSFSAPMRLAPCLCSK
jgi:uncharacterized protein (DUF983 family)